MSAPIPYTVQSGETLQDIAAKLGIKDWTKLKDYHNANSETKVGNTPYTGFSLMTPPKDEVYRLNGETPPPDPAEEQKTEEQKQQEEKKKEEEKKKNEQASKSEHDGKYFVVHGAKCVCDKAENPKQTADLQVTTHSIIVLNDAQGKLAATEEDKTFIPPAATFGKCTLKPSPGGYLPCALAPAPKWNKTYDSTQVKGKNTLTEISELPCMVGGKITVFKHGQTDSVSNAHADNTNPAELAMVNPAVDQPKKKEEYPSVTSIVLTQIENRINFKEIDSKNKDGVVYLRKDEEASFKANLKSGNKQLTSWMVYSDHQGKKENRVFLREQIGTEFSQSFEGLGKFRIEGYGKPKSPEFEKGKYDKCDPTCSIDVEVVENTLLDLESASGDFTTRIDPSKNRKFRRGVPSVFKAKFFIPDLTEEEKSRLTLSVLDGTENTITEGVQVNGNTLTFTPKNTKAKYTVVARYTNDQGEVIEKKMSGETESNAVLGISHGAEIVRPGTAMSFSVSKMKYKFGDDNSPYGLTSDESAEIKWNLNGVLQGTGKNITIPGSRLMIPGKYIVEAYSITANAATKKEDDDWHFEVKENIVTEIKTGKKARTGSEVPFEISKTLLNGYDPAKDGPIVWKVTGPASGTGSGEKFNYKFLLPGEYTINCLMGGRSSQTPLKIKVIQPKIFVESSKWIDNDGSSGNVIKEAGYGQEVCAFVKFEGLQGEEVTLQIYDNDSNGVNLVHNIAGTLPENNSGVFWPFTLDNSIKLKIEARGLTKDGKLHFKLAPKDPTLQILNGDKPLGEYLNVSSIPKIVDGYFCDAGDTEKLYNSPIDKALYFKVYAINMVDKKVEVHFMTQSDPYFGFAWNAKQWKDWKDVKDKFSKETFFHKAEGTINKKGELIVKVDPAKLGKPKNYFKIAAIIKITEGEGKEAKEKAAYLEKTDLAILYATAKLPDMVENKGAVKVGREQLSAKDNKESKCPRCEKLTLEELTKVFTNATEDKKKILMNAFNKANTKFGLNTCQQKAHFFAQIMQEVGQGINVKNGESLDYAAEDLPIHFSRFRLDPSKKYNKITNGPNDLAFKYGRSKQNGYKADQEMIANITYANKEDNGNAESGDGWQYRGRGIIQITFKRKYTKINKRIKDDYPEYTTIIDANNINNLDEGTVASMAYWEEYKCWDEAQKGYGRDELNAIVDIINPNTTSRNDRWENLKKCIEIFRVKECTKDQNDDASDGVLEEMKKLVDKHIPYSQNGERASLSEEGLKNLDCSETIGIYLNKLGVMPILVAIHTGVMTTQSDFRKAIGSENIDLVSGSDSSDFKPQRGDIFVWRKSDGVGHTGIVYKYDDKTDLVTILEAIGSVGSADEATNRNNDGHTGKGMSRTAVYKRSGGALSAHAGWKGYFRPKNYTKKL